MKISDSLRPECMPEMVFAITKMASLGKYTTEELMNLITLGVKSDEYKKVFEFCKECLFINVNSDNLVQSNFVAKELDTFKEFRYSICLSIMKNREVTDFIKLVEWTFKNNREIIAANTADKLSTIQSVPAQKSNREYFLGFRFWFVALGFGVISTKGQYTSLIPTPHAIIDQWILKNNFRWGTRKVLFRDFLNALLNDIPVFRECINGNEIDDSFSTALRVLHYSNKIKLVNTPDMSDTWHLCKSKDTEVYRVTEIEVQ